MLRANVGLTAAVLLLTGCHLGSVPTGETRHETTSIDLEKVETARVEIRMDAGELRVTSGTPKLLDADFTYNVSDWKPMVDYRTSGTRGELTVAQPHGSTRLFGGAVYKWELNLNDRLPMDVSVNLGAGEAALDIGRLNMKSLGVNVGVGSVNVDLRGEPARDYNVQIKGGVGEAVIRLPRNVGISATAEGGIGEIQTSGLEKRDGVWVNPERINAAVTIQVDVKGGIGSIRLVR